MSRLKYGNKSCCGAGGCCKSETSSGFALKSIRSDSTRQLKEDLSALVADLRDQLQEIDENLAALAEFSDCVVEKIRNIEEIVDSLEETITD